MSERFLHYLQFTGWLWNERVVPDPQAMTVAENSLQSTSNATGRHRGPKRKLLAGCTKTGVLFVVVLCNGRPSFRRPV